MYKTYSFNISLDRWEPNKASRNVIGKVLQARKSLLSVSLHRSKFIIILRVTAARNQSIDLKEW